MPDADVVLDMPQTKAARYVVPHKRRSLLDITVTSDVHDKVLSFLSSPDLRQLALVSIGDHNAIQRAAASTQACVARSQWMTVVARERDLRDPAPAEGLGIQAMAAHALPSQPLAPAAQQTVAVNIDKLREVLGISDDENRPVLAASLGVVAPLDVQMNARGTKDRGEILHMRFVGGFRISQSLKLQPPKDTFVHMNMLAGRRFGGAVVSRVLKAQIWIHCFTAPVICGSQIAVGAMSLDIGLLISFGALGVVAAVVWATAGRVPGNTVMRLPLTLAIGIPSAVTYFALAPLAEPGPKSARAFREGGAMAGLRVAAIELLLTPVRMVGGILIGGFGAVMEFCRTAPLFGK